MEQINSFVDDITEMKLFLGRRISTINEKILRKLAEDKAIPLYEMAMDDSSSTYDLVVE